MSNTYGITAVDGLTEQNQQITDSAEALRSSFSDPSAPTTPAPVGGQLWWNSSTFVLSVYNDNIAAFQPISNNDSDTTLATTAGLGEETLKSFPLAANYFGEDGSGIDVIAFFIFAANANNKRVKFDFGGTTILDTGNQAWNGGGGRFECTIVRTGATAQIARGTWFGEAPLDFKAGPPSAPTETMSGAITVAIKVTTPVQAGDASVQMWKIKNLG